MYECNGEKQSGTMFLANSKKKNEKDAAKKETKKKREKTEKWNVETMKWNESFMASYSRLNVNLFSSSKSRLVILHANDYNMSKSEIKRWSAKCREKREFDKNENGKR